jgi:hypothetical protein
VNPYLKKYGCRPELIEEWPQENLHIVVVIPACGEPSINETLNAIYSCERPPCSVEVLIIINASEKASPQIIEANEKTFRDCEAWQKQNGEKEMRFYAYIENDMPDKHAGVGLARKIGMDEAVRRFEKSGNKKGIIACIDADSTCASNYLMEIYHHFEKYPKTPGCSIRYAHPTFGTEYEPYTYLGITYYELHLRYYNQALRSTGFPNAFHTVGSSMAVRSIAYQKQGGMNRRKAGEDFYFLHKIMNLGGFTELNSTSVYPSPRGSDRVPFGTGKAVNDYMKDTGKGFYTYNPKAFTYLNIFFKNIPEFYMNRPELVKLGGVIPYIMIDFLDAYFFDERLQEISNNSKGLHSFEKRFYRWFNAFMVLKFVHYVRDNAHPNIRVERAALDFLREINYQGVENINSIKELLEVYRHLDAFTTPAQVLFMK